MERCSNCRHLKGSKYTAYASYCDILSGYDSSKPACSADMEDLSAFAIIRPAEFGCVLHSPIQCPGPNPYSDLPHGDPEAVNPHSEAYQRYRETVD